MSPAPEVVLPHAGDLDQQAARLVQAKQDLAEQQQVLRGTGAEAALVPALQEQLGQAREQIRELQGECAGLRAEVQAGGNQAGDLQQQQATLKLQLAQVRGCPFRAWRAWQVLGRLTCAGVGGSP